MKPLRKWIKAAIIFLAQKSSTEFYDKFKDEDKFNGWQSESVEPSSEKLCRV